MMSFEEVKKKVEYYEKEVIFNEATTKAWMHGYVSGMLEVGGITEPEYDELIDWLNSKHEEKEVVS